MKQIELTKALTNKNNIFGISKAPVTAELLSTYIVEGIRSVLLFALAAIMATSSIASAAIAVCMIGEFNPYMLFPEIPYWCGSVLAISLIAFSVLVAIGCLYTSLYPKFSPKTCRKLKKFALVSLCIFVICFVSGYFVCAISAGTLGFWHEWNWFIR
ncbi:MAG: hypothetical protein CVU91_11300 [Firmicutes bacterium HGW-Firmicutes-16]|nr:MAG: hypothetical protein CVU91_11300 [Firmicutes bacterium HGW-Firmicutes-16]